MTRHPKLLLSASIISLTSTLSFPHHSFSEEIANIFIFAGQSNARGRGTQPGTIPPDPYFSTPNPNTLIFNTFSQHWETYLPGHNSDTSGMGNLPAQYWGPEAEFLHQYQIFHPDEKVYAIKYTIGGTTLGKTAGPNWLPSEHELFDLALINITSAKNQLIAQNLTPQVLGIITYQGESDTSHQNLAQIYQTNKQEYYTQARISWADNSPQTRFIDMRIHKNTINATYLNLVRTAQIVAAANDPNAGLITVDDLSLNPDSLHFPPVNYLEIGRRAYQEWARQYFTATLDPDIIH